MGNPPRAEIEQLVFRTKAKKKVGESGHCAQPMGVKKMEESLYTGDRVGEVFARVEGN